MSQFDQYTGNSDPIISQAGSDLETITADFKAGNITKAEYDELSGDILDSSRIVAQMNDMVRRQAIFDAFSKLANIVSVISSL